MAWKDPAVKKAKDKERYERIKAEKELKEQEYNNLTKDEKIKLLLDDFNKKMNIILND